MNLITDRTSQDVQRWKELHDKGWAAMDETERTEWLGFMKGRYTQEDMNRVESAVNDLVERLSGLGYVYPTLTTKTNWGAKDWPTRGDMARYFGNIAELRNTVPLPADTPTAPTVEQKLNYVRANDIEKILVRIDQIATAIPQAWFMAGEINCGEV